MRKYCLMLLSMLMTAGVVMAEDTIPEKLLLATGNYNGSSARALGLGGAYTGIADDFSSIWWNPAGLAQVKRIELQGSIARSGFANDADYFGSVRDGSTNSTRLNNLGIVLPVPVYQGALSFAFGYTQVADFDRRTTIQASTVGTQFWDEFDELETGRLGFWSLAGAVDVSPNLALGMGINYWTGFDDYEFTGSYTEGLTPYNTETALETSLSGWNFSFGGLFRAGRIARIGAMAQTAMTMSLDEEFVIDEDPGHFDYRMAYPSVFRFGGSIAPGRWLVTADVEYRDWQSLRFKTDTPFSGVSKTEANLQIKDNYESTTRFALGGEYLFPMYGVRLRAGYSFEPSNFAEHGSDADKGALSFGMGVLIDRSVMLDATYRTAAYTENFTPGLNEDIRSSAAVVTISYRM
ncbi:outer membrane protein transport protein [bacterium]|nr:outer membrane protein transport protein [bacterium]